MFEPVHILLVEDSRADRKYICALFDKLADHSRISCATTVEEGLEALRTQWFDCALLDWQLPDGDALKILKALRKEIRPVPPAVILTGVGSEQIAADAFAHGAADYLRKEKLTPETLRHSVEEAIRSQRAAKPAIRGALMPGEAEVLLEDVTRALVSEIQPPIRFINGLMRELRDTPDEAGEGRQALLESLSTQAARAQRVIGDLLHFERVRRNENLICAVDPRDAIGLARFGLEDALDQPGALDLGELPLVMAAPHQLVDLFRELLENCINFRGSSPLRIRIDGQRRGRMVRITVDDEGVGIPPGSCERVFGLFRRLDDKTPGSGIGLSLARRIVHVHGGLIWCDPRKVGTRVRFTLPAAEGLPQEVPIAS